LVSVPSKPVNLDLAEVYKHEIVRSINGLNLLTYKQFRSGSQQMVGQVDVSQPDTKELLTREN